MYNLLLVIVWTVISVQSMAMVVQHQVDGGIEIAFLSTSTTTMEDALSPDHRGLYTCNCIWCYIELMYSVTIYNLCFIVGLKKPAS